MKNKTIRVLIDLERLRYENSGIANVFKNLAIGLSILNIPKSEFKIDLYGPLVSLKKLNTKFSFVKRKSVHKIVPLYTFKYNILHTSHQLSSYFHIKKRGQKKVVTLHDLNFLHENISQKKYNKELTKVKKNIQNADVIVCISKFVKKDFFANKELFFFKKEPKIEVIYNGICFPKADNTYDLEDLSFLKNKSYILNIGVLFSKKNQLALIKMLPYIKEDLVLVVSARNQFYAKEIENEIIRLGVAKRVHFCSQISDNQKWGLLQHCTALCHPSTAEGFGIPPIEAMHFGKPVFLSNLTSLPEIGGNVAYYFNSFETQSMVATFKKGMEFYDTDRDTKIVQLKKRAQEFDYKVMAQQYLDLYKTLFNNE